MWIFSRNFNFLFSFFPSHASLSIPLFLSLSHHCFYLLSHPLSSLLCVFCLLPLPFFISPLPTSSSHTERPQPPRKLSVPQDGVESRQLRLHWVNGGSGSSPLRYFTLQIKELPSGDWTTHTTDIPHNLTAWTVDRYTHVLICTVTHTQVLKQCAYTLM